MPLTQSSIGLMYYSGNGCAEKLCRGGQSGDAKRLEVVPMEELRRLKRASYRVILVSIFLAVVLNLIVLGGPVAASAGYALTASQH